MASIVGQGRRLGMLEHGCRGVAEDGGGVRWGPGGGKGAL